MGERQRGDRTAQAADSGRLAIPAGFHLYACDGALSRSPPRAAGRLIELGPQCPSETRDFCLEPAISRSEEHTSELQSLMRNSYAVFCLKKKKTQNQNIIQSNTQ